MANPTTLTRAVKNDPDVLTDLQNLGLSVGVTSYVSSSGQITFTDTPLQEDENIINNYFSSGGNYSLS